MACFLVPATEAIITTTITYVMKKKAKSSNKEVKKEDYIPFYKKLSILNKLLWGGSGLLAFEHLWHGEIVPWFPFLTGALTPESTGEMLSEMGSVGVMMAVLVTATWFAVVKAISYIEKKPIPIKEN